MACTYVDMDGKVTDVPLSKKLLCYIPLPFVCVGSDSLIVDPIKYFADI